MILQMKQARKFKSEQSKEGIIYVLYLMLLLEFLWRLIILNKNMGGILNRDSKILHMVFILF